MSWPEIVCHTVGSCELRDLHTSTARYNLFYVYVCYMYLYMYMSTHQSVWGKDGGGKGLVVGGRG